MSDKKNKVDPAVATASDPPIVNHTPIIITDGSASIEFTINSYTQDMESNNNTAKADQKLHMTSVVSDRPHTLNGADNTCFTFVAGELYEVEVKCRGGGGFNNLKIRGSLDPLADLPAVDFDRGEYREDPQGEFRPRNAGTGHRFGTLARRVRKLRIFRVTNGQRVLEHDCPLVSALGNAWTVNDPHMPDHVDNHVHPEALAEDKDLQPA